MNAPTTNKRTFNRERWWTQQYRIVQTNLREIDAVQDPRQIARSLKEFGADVVVSNIGGIVAFYPTELALQYRNPFLRGDFVGEMIDAAHAEGMAYIGRFDLSKAMKPTSDAHPEWFMRNRDGSLREYEGTYQACPNGGWAQEYGPQILREALTRYAPDGLFFNMTGFPPIDYSNSPLSICVCDNCRSAFRKMYDLELPQTDGPTDPNWKPYQDFQRRTTDELMAKVRALVRELRPGVPVMGFLNPDVVARGELQRRVHRNPPEWPYQSGEQSRWIQARTGKPFSATSTAHIDFPWRQVTETAACHELRFAQALATGANLDLYLMGTLQDQDDQSFLKPVSDFYRWYGEHGQYYAGQKTAARVALYQSEAMLLKGATIKAPWVRNYPGAFKGAYAALVDSRTPFWMISGDRLAKEPWPLAKDFDVILLPHVLLLSDAECRALDDFVSQGGLLITTGLSGAYGEDGKLQEGPRLASSPVETFRAPVVPKGWSLDVAAGSLQCGASRIPLDGHFFPVTPKADSENLIPFAPDQRFGPPELSYALPDAARRDESSVLVRSFGKGRAVHLPWLPDWQYHRDGLPALQGLLAELIVRYAPPAPVKLIGEGPVELTVQSSAGGAVLVHIVNYAGQRNGRYDTPPALHGLQLGVRGRYSQAIALVGDQPLHAMPGTDDDYTWFALPPVRTFQAVYLMENPS